MYECMHARMMRLLLKVRQLCLCIDSREVRLFKRNNCCMFHISGSRSIVTNNYFSTFM